MKQTFTSLKQAVYLTLSLILVCGNLIAANINSTHYLGLSKPANAAFSRIAQGTLSLSNLAPLAQILTQVAYNDTTASGKTYYWVPFGLNNRGSGAWSELGHWATTSGGKEKHETLPTPADDVVFDLNSFLFTGQKVTVDVEANVKNISWVNIRFTTFEGSTSSLNVYGSFQAHNNLLIAGPAGFTITFKSDQPDTPINFLNKSFPAASKINFDGPGGWILQNQLSTAQGSSLTLTAGTLKTNNFNIAVNTFRSVGDKARTLELGTSVISGLSTWDVSGSLTLKAEESKIVLDGLGLHTFNGGGKAYRVVTLHGPESIVTNSNTFKELSLPINPDVTATNTLNLESGQVQTIETLSTPGSAPYTTIKSSVGGSKATINFTSLAFCTDYLILSDVHATGPGNYYAGLNSENKGNNTGWHFIPCATSVYAPKTTADYNEAFASTSTVSEGLNKWLEIKYNGELIGAIKDGGNILGEVTIQFAIDSSSSRTLKGTNGEDIKVTPRNWRITSTNPVLADKPVSIRLYGLQDEFDAFKAANISVTTLNDLNFTSYSSVDSTENCDFTDNLSAISTTTLISNPAFTTAGDYFTAELIGITDFTELYLHNGEAAIDFVASKPTPPVVEEPEEEPVKEDPTATVEEMDFTAHWNAKTVKLKWMVPGRTTASYDVERASSLESKEFKTIISNAPRQNSANAAVAVYHAEDYTPAASPANYYRLKRTNADATVTYSQTLKVDNKAYATAVQASPNPFTDKVKLTVNAEKAGELSVKLMTEQGNVALEKKIKVAKGTSESELVIGAKVKAGIYLLVTELNGERLSQRLIKQ